MIDLEHGSISKGSNAIYQRSCEHLQGLQEAMDEYKRLNNAKTNLTKFTEVAQWEQDSKTYHKSIKEQWVRPKAFKGEICVGVWIIIFFRGWYCQLFGKLSASASLSHSFHPGHIRVLTLDFSVAFLGARLHPLLMMDEQR